MANYHFFDKARNDCNNQKLEVIDLAKQSFETPTGFNPDPEKLFRTLRKSLHCMFPSSLPVFGTVLQADDV